LRDGRTGAGKAVAIGTNVPDEILDIDLAKDLISVFEVFDGFHNVPWMTMNDSFKDYECHRHRAIIVR
jgi:hypothetical protein